MNQILFIDDDPNILRINKDYFTPRGYEVYTALDADSALGLVTYHDFDCIILDVILPTKEDGYALCRKLREQMDTPILFLTSLTKQDFLYQGFNCGGDDFMTKPYDLKELQLRIDAQIRRYRSVARHADVISFPPLSVDLTSRLATVNGEELNLTGGEFDILALLVSHPNQVFSPESIYTSVWKMPGIAATHTIQVHVSHLRRKIEDACPDHKFIQTSWGKGYLFVPPAAE